MQNVPRTLKRKGSEGEEEMKGNIAVVVDESVQSKTDVTVKSEATGTSNHGGGGKKKKKGKR